MNAPHGSDIKLLSRNDPVTVKIEKHIWFKWWGGQPLHPQEVHAATIIKKGGLQGFAYQDDQYVCRRPVFHHAGDI
jgi:hypothetical protein